MPELEGLADGEVGEGVDNVVVTSVVAGAEESDELAAEEEPAEEQDGEEEEASIFGDGLLDEELSIVGDGLLDEGSIDADGLLVVDVEPLKLSVMGS